MVKVTKTESQKNRTDVLLAAGRSIREHGIASAGVSDIAKKAGLTHGAVYRHFPSKTALVSAAIKADFDTIVATLDNLSDQGAGVLSYVESYLDTDHRDHFVWGCPAAPLASEVMRTEPEVQKAFHNGLLRNLDGIVQLLKEDDAAEAKAKSIVMLASMVGAMALARATKTVDPELSRSFLGAMKRALSTTI